MAKNISTNQQPRFAKVEVVDQYGNRKIANIPVSELNRMKRPQVQMNQNAQGIIPKKEKVESENFFVGGEQEETQKDIKVEMVDEEGNQGQLPFYSLIHKAYEMFWLSSSAIDALKIS